VLSQYDTAVIEFGDVTNDGSSNALDTDSMIFIEWDAVTMDTIDNNTEYWVSAGAEYNDHDNVWIGQAGFVSLLDDLSTLSRPAAAYSIVFSSYSSLLSIMFDSNNRLRERRSI